MATQAELDAIFDETVAAMRSLATVKGQEYAGDVDRLENFRRNGEHLCLPMETIWRVYAGKHWDALTTYIKDLIAGHARERSEPIDGRIDDLMVYLLLLKLMVRERGSQPQGSVPPP